MNSMTGFVFDVVKTKQGIITLSIRSLNHRYLDIFIKLPETFKTFEFNIRQLLQERLKRGKVELVLKFQPSATALDHFAISEPLLDKLTDFFQQLQQSIPNTQIELTRLLGWPGILNEAEMKTDDLEQIVLREVKVILDKLLHTRRQEGKQLRQYIESTLKAIQAEHKLIQQNIQHALTTQRNKLSSQLKQLEITIDQNRIAQEVALLVQKADITEEVDRIEAYLGETLKVIQSERQTGRRLDFLMQELNREANTICSKSNHVKITQAAIEMKVLIEQIREQAQNLE